VGWRKIQSDASFEVVGGREYAPVVTFQHNYGQKAQIIVEDGHYALFLQREGGFYVESAWIFPEAWAALRELPNPKEAKPTY